MLWTAVFIILLLVIALLLIPLSLSFHVAYKESLQSDIKLHWLFGVVRITLPKPEPGGDKHEKRKKSRKTPKKKKPVSAFFYRPFIERIIKFIGDIWQATHKTELKLRIRMGLGDPADTGQLWSLVGPIAGNLANTRGAVIRIDPDFTDAVLEAEGGGEMRVIPLQLIYLIAGLFLSPSVWKVMRT